MTPFIIENDGTVTTQRDLKGFTIDNSVGTGAALKQGLTMTATGWKPSSDVEAYVRAEALRLRTAVFAEV